MTDVFVYGDAWESDTWTVTLLNMTDSVVAVMFWDGICYDGRTELYRINVGSLTALRYRDEILDPIVRPFLGALGDNALLVQEKCQTSHCLCGTGLP